MPSLAYPIPPFTLPGHTRWSLGQEAQGREQMKSLLPSVNVCLVCKHGESAYCLQGYVCPLSTPTNTEAGGLARFTFLGCTSISPVAMKVPGPHSVWFLTSNPSSSTGFFTVHLKDCFCPSWSPSPPFFFPLFPTGIFFQTAPSSLPHPDLPSPALPPFPKLPAHFIHSLIRQIFFESCCMPDLKPVSRTPKMNWGWSQPQGDKQDCCPGFQLPWTECRHRAEYRAPRETWSGVLQPVQGRLGPNVPVKGCQACHLATGSTSFSP